MRASARKTTRPPNGGLSMIRLFAIEENLERAKGLEPSTPTLARSCSTTELHPHPRWRRTRAVNGRPMPNADRECNSPHAIRCHADNPISLTNGSELVRNNAQTGFAGSLKPTPGTQDQAASVTRGRFEPFFGRAFHFDSSRAQQSQSKVLWLASTGHRRPAGFQPIQPPLPDRRPPIEFCGQAAI
jgi:hypothetical protein